MGHICDAIDELSGDREMDLANRRSMIQGANFELEVRRTFLLGQPSLRIPFAFLFYLRSDAVPA